MDLAKQSTVSSVSPKYSDDSSGIEHVDDTDEETDGGGSRDDNNNKEFTVRLPYYTLEEYEVSGVSGFNEVIDVRTPLEFAEDRIPGAVNWPVLSNEERVTVGSLYAK